MDAQELFGYWRTVREYLYQALDKLTDEQLAFRPREGLWSLHETVCHIAGTENAWFGVRITHEFNNWAEADFHPADYPRVADLKALLEQVHTRIEAIYAEDADQKLKEVIDLPWGEKTTQQWIVWHVLEHEIHHRGEIFLMLGLLGLRAPDI
jgi:uncharacterized damage-inducible protein DinB